MHLTNAQKRSTKFSELPKRSTKLIESPKKKVNKISSLFESLSHDLIRINIPEFFESWVDSNQNSGKFFESWVDSNQNILEAFWIMSWFALNLINPCESWADLNQVFLSYCESRVESNQNFLRLRRIESIFFSRTHFWIQHTLASVYGFLLPAVDGH